MPIPPTESGLPSVALMTDLWPSRSEPTSGVFVREEVRAVGAWFKHVVLVPDLRFPRAHRLIWRDGVPGWQRDWHQAPGPHVLATYSMIRIPKGSERLPRTLGAARALRRLDEHVDLVHGHFLYGVAPAAVSLARKLGKPAVVTAHGTDSRWLRFGGVQERLRQEMLAACRDADRVIAVSGEMADGLCVAGVPASKVTVIPMGVDAETFRLEDRSRARSALGLDEDAPIVLFVGRAVAAKGFDILAQALARLDGVRCYAAGPGPLESPHIHRLGVIESAQVAMWLGAADLFCLPSFGEGMPVSVAEALAAGRPVVATTVGGIPEQVEPGRNGLLVAAGDAHALADALRAALATDWSPEEIRATSERFWWSNVGPRLEALYRELIG